MKGTHLPSCSVSPLGGFDSISPQLNGAGTSPVPGCQGQQRLMQEAPWAQRVPPAHHCLLALSQQVLNLQVPELAGFLLLSFLIQLPLLLFLLMDRQVIHLPLEVPMHSLFLAFLLPEIVAAFLALRTMTKQLAAQFYLRQFQEGGRGQLEPGGTGGQAAKMG